jgi:hypothetical protein
MLFSGFNLDVTEKSYRDKQDPPLSIYAKKITPLPLYVAHNTIKNTVTKPKHEHARHLGTMSNRSSKALYIRSRRAECSYELKDASKFAVRTVLSDQHITPCISKLHFNVLGKPQPGPILLISHYIQIGLQL